MPRYWFSFGGKHFSVVGDFEFVSDVVEAIHKQLGPTISTSPLLLNLRVGGPRGIALLPEDPVSFLRRSRLLLARTGVLLSRWRMRLSQARKRLAGAADGTPRPAAAVVIVLQVGDVPLRTWATILAPAHVAGSYRSTWTPRPAPCTPPTVCRPTIPTL